MDSGINKGLSITEVKKTDRSDEKPSALIRFSHERVSKGSARMTFYSKVEYMPEYTGESDRSRANFTHYKTWQLQ